MYFMINIPGREVTKKERCIPATTGLAAWLAAWPPQ
ncbi:unnamed protein product [Brugia timori]|uniref:Uncharacterized protein n=1 Tax=Brugia timori TaxID=42155 RepID=A0A3P7UAE1_9BILA|nr:unnamed protein product [Brugia timori]